MIYVIDSSVAFKWVVLEVDSPKAINLRDAGRNGIHKLVAPDVFSIEVAHALTRAERQGRIPIGHAIFFWADVLAEPLQLFLSDSLIRRAIQISSAMRVGVYDCIYVALAEREQYEFVTPDNKLLKNLQKTFPFIISFDSLP